MLNMHPVLKSFIAVVTLTAACFGILFGTNCCYQLYRSEQNTKRMIAWIAARDDIHAEEEAVKEQSGTIEMSKVHRLIVDADGNVLEGRRETDRRLVKKILARRNESGKVSHFVYSKRNVEGSLTLIVMADMSQYRMKRSQIVSTAVLSSGESILIAPTAYSLVRIIAGPIRRSARKGSRVILNAGHGLKTSLSILGVNAQAIQAESGENCHVSNIISETQNMNHLIERMMTLSRIEEERNSTREEFSLSSTVMESALAFESLAYDRHIEYGYQIGESIRMIGDEEEIRQLTAILIDNAVKYTEEGGSVHIELKKNGKNPVLQIVNSGKGIEKEDLPHIFDQFYHKGEGGNTQSYGLGLAIAEEIVKNHGGTITAESKPGIYTRFRVSF